MVSYPEPVTDAPRFAASHEECVRFERFSVGEQLIPAARLPLKRRHLDMQNKEQGQQTGTRNETYDVIAVLYHALQGAENCQTYVNDAQDSQIRDFFQQALQLQRQLADQGKQVLQQCL